MSSDKDKVSLITASGLRMAFGGVEVVKGVDIELRAGEVHAIMGENGAGKSTVAKMVAGVYRPTGGTIRLRGQETQMESPRHALELGIALIHQEPLTFPDLTVAENIFVGHQPARGPLKSIDWREMNRCAEELLASLGAKIDPKVLAGGLSVADQQMIELASALSHDAKVLLMDETTASLTPKEVAELFEIVRRLRDEGRAITFVSHRLSEIFDICDRITIMRDGEKVGERMIRDTSIPEVVSLMVGRDVPPPTPRPAPSTTVAPILKVSGLSKRGRFENISFELRPGEIVALAGLVGAGRTDVCEIIFGAARPTAGEIEVRGAKVTIKNPRDAIRNGLAMVPEDRQHAGLLLPMSIAHNATLPTLKRTSPGGWLSEKRERATAEEFAKKLRTALRSVEQPVKELSGGNQQKIVLAKWLMTEPKILILDEPTRGVDVGAKEEIHRLIRELVDQGMAVLMVSSDLTEVLELSDRILVMREGRLVAEFAQAQATPDSVMFAATGQEAYAA